MRRLIFTTMLMAAFLLQSGNLYAQRDVDTILHGNPLDKLVSIYGNPLEREDFDGEGGPCTAVRYPDFYATIDREIDRIDGISIFSNELCVLSSLLKGGIQVGDNMSKYKDIDFTMRLTGRHYEGNGLLKLSEPIRIYPSGRVFNYGILSKGVPYRIYFSIEASIIKEIYLEYLQDYPSDENHTEIDADMAEGHSIND